MVNIELCLTLNAIFFKALILIIFIRIFRMDKRGKLPKWIQVNFFYSFLNAHTVYLNFKPIFIKIRSI